MNELDEARKKRDDDQYSERLAAGLLEQIKYSKSLEDLNKKIRLELHTLRFKESQEQRFIWWIYQVYSRNVCDLIYEIMGATTYDTEGEAKDGKYALPKHCFDLMKRIYEYTEHIYDGTYLAIEVSTENKTVPENKPEYTEPSNNDGSATQNVCSWIQEDDPEINLWRTSCHNTFYLDADKPSDNHMKYCCYCGKKIKEEA